ncbi:SusC/RagA family TonB-linked outer membrane protein [Parapedobacter sp. 10938]|uniref:SusC/RagA family TonB-linked outer membrane protein n=1 Tax=Parapedobacter flavus TaxID=3110225 RepID=UPI002DBBDB4B|nr:TonB-dependent receptor [Parapedobacter sp. 10938]MEC3878303.1 TonB-dependent receptor [Parapedobacter sp. 10938]
MKGKIYKCVVLVLIALLPSAWLAGKVSADPVASWLQERTITGRIMNAEEAGIIGASIKIKGTSVGTASDLNGNFSLTVPNDDVILEISSVGWVSQEVPIRGLKEVRVTLEEATEGMDEVVVTAFGAVQKKESVVSAISTINPAQLRVPSSNLTQAFAGRMSGVIAYQRSGEPGLDNAEFFIRGITTFSTGGKRDPLILIDGIEMSTNDLARLNVDDIESFSVLKDASAAALYGARGANGVILVTTKVGKADRLTMNVRAEQTTSINTKLVELADPITYMRLHNEAVRTRDAERLLPHRLGDIYETERGSDPIRYPNVDWYDYLLKDHATNRRVNLNLTGGGQSVQYYLAAGYQNDQGILKETEKNLFDNNINIDRLQIRSNVTIRFAPNTTGVVRAYGSFDDRTGPNARTTDYKGKTISGGAAVFHWARNATPVKFLPYYPADATYNGVQHTLFGMGPELGEYVNPLAQVVSSNQESKESTMLLQLEMEHKFLGALEGLTVRGTFNAMRKAYYALERNYRPFFYTPMTTIDGSYRLQALNPDTGTEYLIYAGDSRSVNATQYGELRLSYNKLINDVHDINALVVGTMRNETGTLNFSRVYDDNNATSDPIQASLPMRNISTAARVAYGYDSRYFVQVDVGINGTERFAARNRWGVFPTIGVGWAIHNERFMSNSQELISNLRLRGTYGRVGNDAIGHVNDRFFYLSQVNMSGPGYWFGLPGGGNIDYWRTGIQIDRYANELITWEIATKSNIGLEIGLFNNAFTLNSDYFWETRENILQTRPDIPTSMGLRTIPQANLGIASGKGFETEMKYEKNFSSDVWLLMNANFTYATAKYKYIEEADYSDVPWRSSIGRKLNQPMGYIAERLFIDEEEVNNSPSQFSGQYLAGDIKYKDIDGDGLVNQDDMVPIGYPTVPEIIYGGGFTFGYKAFDVSVFFQGSARSSFFIEPAAVTPFVNQGQRGLLKYIAEDHWSETNRDIYAFWPRLSDYSIANNNHESTYWIQNGAFVRLKQAEVGYTLPQHFTNRYHINSLRVYASGTNLARWSHFKMWDPEMAGNGLGYPLQRVFNLGVSVGF